MRTKKLLLIIFLNSCFLFKLGAQECGTPTNGVNQDFSYMTNSSTSEASICINVFFHIVRQSSGTGGFNSSNIDLIVEDLNEYYNPYSIYIHKQGTDFIDNSTYFDLTDSEFNSLINQYSVSNSINFYLVNSFLTYAGKAENILSKNLAVVNNHALSPTSAHELGHCLNLWHTHHGLGCGDTGGCAESINGSNCSTCGDFVCDTPADPCVLGQYNLNCQYTGGGGYNPDVTNIMSYGGLCRNHFTMGQATRMKNSIQGSSLLQQVIGNSCLIPKLTGSDTVCYSNTVYSLQNGGSNVTWQVSSNLQIVSSSNTSITVKAMSSLTQGSGYIKAILQYQNLQKDVWVGKFLPLDLRLRDPSTNNPVYFICYLQSTTVKATHDSGTVPDSWQWSVSGASVTYPYSSNNSLATLHPYSYNITVKIKAHNDCGWSDWADVTPDVIPCGMYFTVSPNPAQSEITITPVESTTDEANISNTNDTQNRIPVDIELYDITGIKVKQTAFNMGDPMTMDVSRLRNGIYFLKIIVGDYIETHQLVIH